MELNKNDPDYIIELFWYGFKNSMINFYNSINMITAINHINKWSENLNELKKLKKYQDIENYVREYITKYSFDLIKYSTATHHDEILSTNIKRWNNISSMFNFNSNVYSKILQIFIIYLKVKKNNDYEFLKSLQPIEMILDSNDFSCFIKYGFERDKPAILEALYKIPTYDLIDNIQKTYPHFEFNKNMKIMKIYAEYKKIFSTFK